MTNVHHLDLASLTVAQMKGPHETASTTTARTITAAILLPPIPQYALKSSGYTPYPLIPSTIPMTSTTMITSG